MLAEATPDVPILCLLTFCSGIDNVALGFVTLCFEFSIFVSKDWFLSILVLTELLFSKLCDFVSGFVTRLFLR